MMRESFFDMVQEGKKNKISTEIQKETQEDKKLQEIREKIGEELMRENKVISDTDYMEVEEKINDYFVETFAEMMFVEKEKIEYLVDFSQGKKEHGHFWNREEEKKIDFFVKEGMIISFPDGTVRCDEAEDFPEELKKDCKEEIQNRGYSDDKIIEIAQGWRSGNGLWKSNIQQ